MHLHYRIYHYTGQITLKNNCMEERIEFIKD
jgi:hypothetical protein